MQLADTDYEIQFTYKRYVWKLQLLRCSCSKTGRLSDCAGNRYSGRNSQNNLSDKQENGMKVYGSGAALSVYIIWTKL